MAPIETDARAVRVPSPTTKLVLPGGTGALKDAAGVPAPSGPENENVPAGTGAKAGIGLEAVGTPGGLATAGPPDPKEFADLITRQYGLVDANLKTPDRPEELVPSYPPVSTPPAPEPKPEPKPEPCPPEKKAEGLKFKSHGDPHEVSGDGLKFDNQLVGDFIAMKSKSGDLMLQKRHENVGGQNNGVTFNTEASLQTGSDVIHFDSQNNTLTLNGKPTSLANGQTIALPGGGTVTRNGNDYTIKTPQGDRFTFIDQGQYMDIDGELSASRKDGEVIGSLGRFDADSDASNDLVMPDGSVAKDLNQFLEAWRVPYGQRLIPGIAEGDPNKPDPAALKAQRIMLDSLAQVRAEEEKRRKEAAAKREAADQTAAAAAKPGTKPSAGARAPAEAGAVTPVAPATATPAPAAAAVATPIVTPVAVSAAR